MSSISSIQTPKEAGFSMPPEWTPHARCWMAWPRDMVIWDDLERTRAHFAGVAKAIRTFEPVTMVVDAEDLEGAKALCGDEIDFLVMPLDDSWMRDIGPNFLKRGEELAASIFHFNAWGQKYERYRNDAAVGHRIAEHIGIPTFSSNVFMEGGGIFVDGEGTVLTTEQCILNENRNPGLTKSAAEEILCHALGAEKVIWIPGDPADNETDGHVDGLASFVKPGVVLCETAHPGDAERQKQLGENWRALELATDAKGRKLELIPINEAYDADPVGERYCGSFINFYIANGGIVMPRYGIESDAEAQATLAAAFPDRKILPVEVDHIVIGGGGIHCITQQQPA